MAQFVDHMTVMWPADTGFEIPNEFVVGYALDYNEYFRDLNVNYNNYWSTPNFMLHTFWY